MNIELFEDSSADHFINSYLSLMDRLMSWNHQYIHWHFSYLGTKQRFSSPFAKILPEFFSQSKTKQVHRENFSSLSFPTLLGDFSIECLADGKRQLRLQHTFRTKLQKVLRQIRFQASWLKQFLVALRKVLKTQKRIKSNKKKQDVTCIIKSFTYKNSFNSKNQFNDPYFKELSNLLAQQDNNIKIATVVEGADQPNFKNQQLLVSRDVDPIEKFLRLSDVLKSFFTLSWKILIKPFRIDGPLFFDEIEITTLVKEIFSTNKWNISFCQSLYYDIGKNIIRTYPALKSVMITYEGNPWERMLIKGLREGKHDIHIVGYQHSVVPQSALSMFMGKKEAEYMYQPNTLLTTGEAPKSIIEQYGDNSKQSVIAACALRYDHLHKISHERCRPDPERIKILVAMEGLEEATFLLLYAIRQAELNPKIVFRVRAHPALSFSQMLQYTNYQGPFPDNLEISENCTLEADIIGTDILLYWGTTVALEAVLMGKPIVHLDRGDLLSYDPLFQLKSFKWVATPDLDIMILIDDIIKLSDQEFNNLAGQARDYVLSYFHPVTDQNLAPCLDQIS